MNLTLQEIAYALGGEIRGNQVLAPGPGHSPKDRSLAVKLSHSPDGFVVFAHAPKDNHIECKDHVRNMLGLPQWQKSGGERHVVARYDYHDESGTLLFQVVRFVPKGFTQRRPNGSGDWTWSLGDCRRVLYRLPELVEAVSAGKTICIVEGEKAADALAEVGVRATCSPHGAGKWRDQYSKHLAGADVVILPDNDAAGELHQAMVVKSLTGVAGRVRVLRLPDLPEGGDVYDWLKAGGDAKQLAQAVGHANEANGPEAQPKQNGGFRNANAERRRAESARLADKYITRDGKPPVEDEVERLSGLSDAAYEQERKEAASSLGVRVSALDKLVAATKGARAEGLVPEPEPWTDPVLGEDLLDLIVDTARDHIVLPEGGPDVVALWTTFAHCHDCFDISPLLAITSPTPECGKTVLCDLLDGLVPRPLSSCNVSSAVVYRAVEHWNPTLMIDEADTFLPDNAELRGILDSGHRRSNAFVLRTVGDNHEPKQFTTWAPKVLALIGKLPPTLASRSIHIRLRRMLATETVMQLRFDQRQHLVPIKRRLIRWAQDNAKTLRAADPVMPNTLRGRAADNWRPLLAIADAIGGEWPERARKVAELFSVKSADIYGIMVLQDIAIAFTEKNVDRFPSAELTAILNEREDRPWPEYRDGKKLTQRQLAKLLEPFDIAPGTIRIDGPKPTAKGYYLSAFEDAFRRYLSPDTPFPSVTASQPAENKDF